MVIEKCCKTQTKSNKILKFLENLEIDSDMAASFVFRKKKIFLGGAKGGRNFHEIFFLSHSTFIHVYLNKLSYILLLNGRDKKEKKS